LQRSNHKSAIRDQKSGSVPAPRLPSPAPAVLLVVAVLGILAASPLWVGQAEAAWRQGPDQITVGDGHGGIIAYPAKKQTIAVPGCTRNVPFGLVQMDNGQVAMVLSAATMADGTDKDEHPVITFSSDAGNSWSTFQNLPTNGSGSATRPLMLTYLGGGKLSYASAGNRYFSTNYGQAWSPPVAIQSVKGTYAAGYEGNDGVDRDTSGNAVRLNEIDYYWPLGYQPPNWPQLATNAVFRYSLDQGRTWQGEVQPPDWKWNVTYNGTVYQRGVSEGSVVRAANGWLVAALRTDMPPRFIPTGGDYLEGTGVSISKDNGANWTPVKDNILFEAGRHHASLHRLANGELVMTLACRDDIRTPGATGLDSNMRGADALISDDNGLTWNLDRRITLDAFEYLNPSMWYEGSVGPLGSTVLSDGKMLTAYGRYTGGPMMLIKWDPTALHLPEPSCWIMLVTAPLGVLAYAWRIRNRGTLIVADPR
jgi:hypothetical protein